MHERTREFLETCDKLDLSVSEVARIVGRSEKTVYQYRSKSPTARVVTERAIERLREHKRALLRERLDRAVADLRAEGVTVEFGSDVLQAALTLLGALQSTDAGEIRLAA